MPNILQKLGTEVPTSKLVLMVTPYAAEKSDDGVKPMKLTDALGIATQLSVSGQQLATSGLVTISAPNIDKDDGRSGINWSAPVACVTFTYEQAGGRTVWIENVFSIGFKLEFISRYGLGGVSIEDASNDPYQANIWPAIRPFVSSGQPLLLQPNPTDLVPKWQASQGTFEGGPKGSINWSTPAEAGAYTVTISVSDGVVRYENSVPMNVQKKDTPNSTPTTSPTATR
jgi:hypothetical protein